ncbi:MAG: hypothetical protein A2X49_15980 [Lentisphaerae bacterium GWF2_52_8]|nr:MAG: hypothetical protein A2X49_15980 [Lentisphaerae bacterium GWF2_52_8]
MSATIKDIALKANVALSTASNVLNRKGGPIKVSPGTSAKVFAAAKALNYTPNVMAQCLRRGKTYLVGVMIEDIVPNFVPELLKGIEDVLHKSGYSILLCSHGKEDKGTTSRVEFLRSKKVDGVIVMPSGISDFSVTFKSMTDKGVPMVLLGYPSCKADCPRVYVDEEKIGLIAARYLLKLGHKEILSMNRRRPACTVAFNKTILKNGARCHYEIPEIHDNFEYGRAAIKMIVRQKLPITAVFAYNDISAAGAIYEAQQQGINIPSDISILGVDDLPICKMVYPNITSVSQPKNEQGIVAGKTLVDLMEGKPKTDRDIVLTPRLIERDSCALYSRQK